MRLQILFPSFQLVAAIAAIDAQSLCAQNMLSLEEAIATGLKNNYAISISRNEAAIAENNSSLGNAGFLPSITADAGYAESTQDTKQQFVAGNFIDRKGAESESRRTGLALSWTVFDGFRMFNARRRLANLQEIGETGLRAEAEVTVAEIVAAYFDVVRQERILNAAQEAVEISQRRVELAEERFAVGSGAGLEVLQAKVDLNTDRSSLLRQELAVTNAKIALNQLLAREPTTEFTPSDTIRIAFDLNYDNLKQATGRRNSALQVAAMNRNVSRLELKEVQAERLPEINLTSGYNYSRSSSSAGFVVSSRATGYNFGLTASLNLFDGFNTNRRAENARMAIQNADLAYQEMANEIEARLAAAFQNYQKSSQLIALERENLKVAQENVDVTFERFRLGTITSVELREAQVNFINAGNRIVLAEYDAKVAETELLRLSGQLLPEENR